MKIFGTKQSEPSDEDRAAAARLSAVAARFKAEPTDFTEVSKDPFGAPEASEEPKVSDEPERSEGKGTGWRSDDQL